MLHFFIRLFAMTAILLLFLSLSHAAFELILSIFHLDFAYINQG